MAKRSLETLVSVIQGELAQATETSPFFAACWQEADADAGYVLHADGRMVGLGEYQYGFDHVNELLGPHENEEVARYARQEAGRIAADMEAVGLEQIEAGDDDYGLLERLPNAFQAQSGLAERALQNGDLSMGQMFDLLAAVPGLTVFEGAPFAPDQVILEKDLVIARLAQDPSGNMGWETVLVAAAGSQVAASARQEWAQVPIKGGYVNLRKDQFQPVSVEVHRRPGM